MESKQDIIQQRPRVNARKQSILDKIEGYVKEHLAEHITLRGVAAYCEVSVSTITQLFQKKLGTTFHQYLTRVRMNVAEELIRSDVPLEEAGRRVGYTDHSTFYRAFRQFFGMSPREFRKELRKEAEV